MLVKHNSNKQTDDLIDNDTVKHATILVSELVKSAKSTILLYTDSFCDTFYNQQKIIDSFLSADKKNVKLSIISKHDIKNNNAFKYYSENFTNDITYQQYSKDITADFDGDSLTLNNFMVIDGRGLRYEQEKKDDICNNIEYVRARGTFNRPEDIKPFISAFTSILS